MFVLLVLLFFTPFSQSQTITLEDGTRVNFIVNSATTDNNGMRAYGSDNSTEDLADQNAVAIRGSTNEVVVSFSYWVDSSVSPVTYPLDSPVPPSDCSGNQSIPFNSTCALNLNVVSRATVFIRRGSPAARSADLDDFLVDLEPLEPGSLVLAGAWRWRREAGRGVFYMSLEVEFNRTVASLLYGNDTPLVLRGRPSARFRDRLGVLIAYGFLLFDVSVIAFALCCGVWFKKRERRRYERLAAQRGISLDEALRAFGAPEETFWRREFRRWRAEGARERGDSTLQDKKEQLDEAGDDAGYDLSSALGDSLNALAGLVLSVVRGVLTVSIIYAAASAFPDQVWRTIAFDRLKRAYARIYGPVSELLGFFSETSFLPFLNLESILHQTNCRITVVATFPVAALVLILVSWIVTQKNYPIIVAVSINAFKLRRGIIGRSLVSLVSGLGLFVMTIAMQVAFSLIWLILLNHGKLPGPKTETCDPVDKSYAVVAIIISGILVLAIILAMCMLHMGAHKAEAKDGQQTKNRVYPYQFLMMTSGLWNKKTVEAFRIREKVEYYTDNPEDDEDDRSEAIIGLTGTFFSGLWYMTPYTTLLAKFGEISNNPPVWNKDPALKLATPRLERMILVVNAQLLMFGALISPFSSSTLGPVLVLVASCVPAPVAIMGIVRKYRAARDRVSRYTPFAAGDDDGEGGHRAVAATAVSVAKERAIDKAEGAVKDAVMAKASDLVESMFGDKEDEEDEEDEGVKGARK